MTRRSKQPGRAWPLIVGALGCAVSVPIGEDDLVLGDPSPVDRASAPNSEGVDAEDSARGNLTPDPAEDDALPSTEGDRSPDEAEPTDEEPAAIPPGSAPDDAEPRDAPESDDAEPNPVPEEPAAPEEPPSEESPPEEVPDEPQLPEEEPLPPSDSEPEPNPNLISNASFEVGLEGWVASFGADLQRSTERAQDGTASARVTARTESWQGAQFDLAGLVSPGSQYETAISVSVGTQTPTPVLFTVQVQCAGQADRFVPIATGTAAGLQWTRLSGTLEVPTAGACNLTGFWIYAEGPPPGIDLFLDEVSVVP